MTDGLQKLPAATQSWLLRAAEEFRAGYTGSMTFNCHLGGVRDVEVAHSWLRSDRASAPGELLDSARDALLHLTHLLRDERHSGPVTFHCEGGDVVDLVESRRRLDVVGSRG